MTSRIFTGLVAGGILAVAVGCESGESWVVDWIGLDRDVSAESISGTYADLTGRRTSGPCDALGDPTPMAADLRIEVDEEREETDLSGRRAAVQLSVCDEGCKRVERTFRLAPTERVGTWRRTTSTSKTKPSRPATRSCEVEWRSDRLVAADEGLEWHTRVHRGTVALEGTMRCNAELASDLGESQSCVRRRLVRARRSAPSD